MMKLEKRTLEVHSSMMSSGSFLIVMDNCLFLSQVLDSVDKGSVMIVALEAESVGWLVDGTAMSMSPLVLVQIRVLLG